ncbi:MAG: NAD(+) synthase [Propionibacteriaceae bacterium]|nr:NAD(+) synthase [Propionibacteriaceae bacterium]
MNTSTRAEQVRIATRVLPILLAQPKKNAVNLIKDIQLMDADGVDLVVYPELCLTGSTCGDLFFHQVLIDATQSAIEDIVQASSTLRPTIVVGAPISYDGELVNCGVVIGQGKLLGLVPKWFAFPDGLSRESRWFSFDSETGPAKVGSYSTVMDDDKAWPVGGDTGVTFRVVVGEECLDLLSLTEDPLNVPPPLVVCPTSTPAAVGHANFRKLRTEMASGEIDAVIAVACSGGGESSTDASWDSQAFIYNRGKLLGETELYPTTAHGVTLNIARKNCSRSSKCNNSSARIRPTSADVDDWGRDDHLSTDDVNLRFPFVPLERGELESVCQEAFNIAVYGLTQRMKAMGTPNLVMGVSGGLDSTLALLVCAKAMDQLGRSRSDILAFTMPGFATSDQTKNSAITLMESLGTTAETIDIRPAATQMLVDLGHEVATGKDHYDVTFENVQAGLRTDYLFRLANYRGGIVVGTGDLSELALGWCTYGVGDHMSHYGVNAGVPKTLIAYLIRWAATQLALSGDAMSVIDTILTQEISPELVPAKPGESMQSTEENIGPYALNDFFLWKFLLGTKPSHIAQQAWAAWKDETSGEWPPDYPQQAKVSYDLDTITMWLEKFLKRFFASQFKRTCLPDGPSIFATVSLSPRGRWIMPSDVKPDTWLEELATATALKET